MKPHLLTLAALGAVAALVVAVIAVAVSSASGTPGGGFAAPSPRPGSGVYPLPAPACSLPGGIGPSAIPVSGVCTGRLAGAFRCVKSAEFFGLSIRRPLDDGNVFYFTVLIVDYTGPGGYPESQGFAQIIGPADPPRWTRRDAITRVNADGSVELGTFLLAAEPGTPATGKILLSGHAACASPDRGLVVVRKH